MKRRDFVRTLGGASLATGGLVAACGRREEQPSTDSPMSGARHHWKMVTTWPRNFPALGTGANRLAALIGEMSGGRIQVKVYGDGELVSAFEVFDAVSRGTAEMGHGSAYYWKGKIPAAQFFSTVPFGFTADEMNAWLYHGGALDIWREVYEPFGLVPAPAGNTGVQMGGWFNKEINSLADLSGLKMRIPGLGGEVLARAGGTPVNLPGGEIFIALQSGAIDATEWVGPYNDLAFGLYKAARYYYYPGWHEPGTTLECIINKAAFDKLSKDLQAVVLSACEAVNQDMLSEMIARNGVALGTLLDEHHVVLRRFPDDVLEKLRTLSGEVVAELAEQDPLARRIYESYSKFRKQVLAWGKLSEVAYLQARNG